MCQVTQELQLRSRSRASVDDIFAPGQHRSANAGENRVGCQERARHQQYRSQLAPGLQIQIAVEAGLGPSAATTTAGRYRPSPEGFLTGGEGWANSMTWNSAFPTKPKARGTRIWDRFGLYSIKCASSRGLCTFVFRGYQPVSLGYSVCCTMSVSGRRISCDDHGTYGLREYNTSS